LKKESQFTIIGTAIPRLDVMEKINGTAMFGTDVFVESMLYGAIARPPAYGAKVLSYDVEAAKKVAGVHTIVRIDRGIGVCADTIGAAWKGRDALKVQWGKGSQPDLSTATLENSLVMHLDKPGVTARKKGDAGSALAGAAKRIEARYLLPFLAHATLSPMNCTAHVRRDSCDIWAPTQHQMACVRIAAKETGLKPEQIHVHTTYLGGGFGRRSETDVVEEAVQLSKAAGRPVKLIWTRKEDTQYDFYRPGNCCKIEGGLDSRGRLLAWSHKIVCPSIFSRVFPSYLENGVDPSAVEGIVDMEYEIPHMNIEYVRMDTPVPVGFWRSVGHSHNAFTVESFIDELAYASHTDPLDFRLNLLKKHARAARVLQLAAEKAGWGKPLKAGQGRGIAYHFSFESRVAHVVEVSVNKNDGTIKVHRIVSAVDCGPAVNPHIIKTQIEGGALMGLSAALKEKVEFAGGGPKSAYFSDYPVLTMSETPDMEVHIVKSEESLGGIGETGLPPIAPALANAVFAATGARLRRLPMKPQIVLEAIQKA
jgi:isoquinoline 1-oxidoreductase beta subunit